MQLDYNVSSGPFLSSELIIGPGLGPELDNNLSILPSQVDRWQRRYTGEDGQVALLLATLYFYFYLKHNWFRFDGLKLKHN